MSSSRHPIALDIERRIGGSTRLLAVVMLLPLVDGVFAALVLAGALDTLAGIVAVGVLFFAGSATIAVILAEMDAPPRQQVRAVLGVGAALVVGAVVVAALAPTIESLIAMWVFERFAALVILAVAATTASARLAEYLPRPGIVVALGLVASVDLSGASFVIVADPELMGRAAAAGLVGVAVALAVALASPWLRNAVDIDRFRFGSAVALGVLGVSVAGLIPSDGPLSLAVLAVTALFAFDPARARERDAVYAPDELDITAAMSDGGTEADAEDSPGSDPLIETESEREPWL